MPAMGWFRKQPLPKVSFTEDAPLGLMDLHSHVLFGLDDGARSIEESDAMLSGLASLGFVKVAATPHFDNQRAVPNVDTQLAVIAEISARRGGELPEVITGAECIFDDGFLALEAAHRVPRLGLGRTYLVELGFLPGSAPIGIENLLFKLQIEGCVLLAAHPERIPDLQRDRSRAAKIRSAGMLFQLDVMSLVGKYGRIAEHTAFDMLEGGMIDLVSTDLHRADDLRLLEKGMTALQRWDAGEFVRLFSTNPALILNGEDVVGGDE